MKLHTFECEIDKLNTKMHRAMAEKDRLEAKLDTVGYHDIGRSRSDLEKSGLDSGARGSNWDISNQRVQRLEAENERLRVELERSTHVFGRTTMTTSQEVDRAQERADKAIAELRRTQAELRVTQV